MLIAMLALLVVPEAVPPGSITVAEVTGTSMLQLAKRLLPAPLATRVIDGRVRRDWLPGQAYTAAFWEEARPAGPTMCQRRFHGLRLANAAAPGGDEDSSVALSVGTLESGTGFGTTYPRGADAATCRGVTAFATPTPAASGATIAAIDALTSAMRAASGPDPLPFELACTAEDGDDACAQPRIALADLPLDVLFGVSFNTGHYRTVSENNESRPRVVVRQMVADPDGKPPKPTIEFGTSGKDGRSWRVELVSDQGRVVAIRMRRSTIIYH